MSNAIFHPARLTAVLLLAAPLMLRADSSPPVSEKLAYERPAGVPDIKTRVPIRVRGSLDNRVPKTLQLVVLCPNHTGLTVQEHPSLFWYMNEPVKGLKCVLTVSKEGEPEPLIEQQVDGEKAIGIQRLNLKDLSKSLDPNDEYKVSVAINVDPEKHADDIVTSGMIKRITAPEKLLSRLLTRPTPAERAVVYAKQGIWYDALAAISDQIAADPANKDLHKARADLLEKGELPEAAAFDRQLAGTESK